MKKLFENWNKYKNQSKELDEARADHISGIDAKLDRLEDEIGTAQGSLDRRDTGAEIPGGSAWETEANLDDVRSSPSYFETQQRIMRMREKIDLLQQQLETLESAPEGEYVGELPRGDG